MQKKTIIAKTLSKFIFFEFKYSKKYHDEREVKSKAILISSNYTNFNQTCPIPAVRRRKLVDRCHRKNALP